MRVDEFDFDLPPDRIAQHPAEPRDSARLLDLTGDGPADRRVLDLPALLRPDDVLVVNDTRVIPARLHGRRGEAAVEVTLHRRLGPDRWRAFARPARKLKPGDRFETEGGLAADVAGNLGGGEVELVFDRSGAALMAALHEAGVMPLPPYIRRGKADRAADARDRHDYQSLFAEKEGAVAAPTASLHFTERLIDALTERGVTFERVTLHVGAGTFLPVKVEDTEDHIMHAETAHLDAATADRLNAARAAGRRIVAIGTTPLRLLESATDETGRMHGFDGETELFITPGYGFRAVDLLLTNFHLPRSTLFMLVAAFAGLERMKAAYDHAIRAGYRFYSYGDACLLARTDGAS